MESTKLFIWPCVLLNAPTKLLLVICLISQSGRSEDLAAQDSIPGYVLLPPPSQLQPHLYQHDFRTVWTREDAQSAPIHQWPRQQNYHGNDAVQLDSHPFAAIDRPESDRTGIYTSLPPPHVAHYATQKPHIYGQQYLRQEVHNPYLNSKDVHAIREPHEHISHGKLVLTLASDPNFEHPIKLSSAREDSSHQSGDEFHLDHQTKPKSLATLLAENLARNEGTALHEYSDSDRRPENSAVLAPEKEADLVEYNGEIDHLYDEFVHMYYDDGVPDENGEQKEDSLSEKSDIDRNNNFSLDVLDAPIEHSEKSEPKPTQTTVSENIDVTTNSPEIQIPTEKNPQQHFGEGESAQISDSITVSIEAQPSPLTPRPSKASVNRFRPKNQQKPTQRPISPKTTYRTKPRIRPLSLSEVIQKMGLSLPSFLVSLQSHGKSLKDVTYQLTQVQLTKTDFRRIRGDVGRLLETLDQVVPSISSSTTGKPSITEISTKRTTVTKPARQFTKSPKTTRKPAKHTTIASQTTTEKIAVSTTTEQSTTFKQVSLSPKIFGSKHSDLSISFGNPKVGGKASIPFQFNKKDETGFLQGFEKIFNITSDMVPSNRKKSEIRVSSVSDWGSVSPKPYAEVGERHRTTAEPKRTTWRSYVNDRKLVNSRFGSTKRPNFRPAYVIPSSPRPGSGFFEEDESKEGDVTETKAESEEDSQSHKKLSNPSFRPHLPRPTTSSQDRRRKYKINAHNADVATKSAILAAVILGSVALTVFIAIFVVVRYKSHQHKRKRRKHLSLHSDSSTSSIPPLYATRSSIYRSSYHSSGFWNSLKRKFDPYSISDSPMSDR